uniref:Uncharacterized protein n=1 Tax=Anopheles atroparvus TaxID=41427 RepID=A0AAG5DCI7_ANOAO
GVSSSGDKNPWPFLAPCTLGSLRGHLLYCLFSLCKQPPKNTRNTEKAKAEELSRVRPTDRLIATPCYTPDRPRTRRCQASNIHTRTHTYTLGQEKEGRKEKERLPKQPTGSRYAVPIS